jgi:HSP20 family protein
MNRGAHRHQRHQNQFFHHLPRVNVLKQADDYKLELAIPGIDKKDVELRVENGQLIVSHKATEDRLVNFLKKGFDLNGFSRSFDLPKNTDQNRIEAEFLNGILSITLPMLEAAKPKTITIQ